jgi:hypothetical protein
MLSSQLRCAIVVSSNLISLEVILNMTTTDGMKIEIGFLSCNLQGCDNLSGRFLFGGKPVSGMLAGLAREPFGVDYYGILLTTLESPSAVMEALSSQHSKIIGLIALLATTNMLLAPADWSRFLAFCLLTSLSSNRTGFNAARFWPGKRQD